jgi:ketosteroid isomerase-like protein
MEDTIMPVDLPELLARYYAAQTRGDTDALAACFAPDAVVRDEGRELHGRAAIAQWQEASRARYRFISEPLAVADRDGRAVVTARVTGDFPGSPITLDYAFTLAGGSIARLEIA